jgi:CRISPR/Cas system-associated exonuclease Cas4 (RecB family)
VRAQKLFIQGGLENLKSALEICLKYGLDGKRIEVEIAKEEEKILDYAGAIEKYTKVGMHEDAARVRKLQADMGSVKVAQKVVHGDEISKTEIKDSVVSRSNVGGGSSKMQELKELTAMKKEGLITAEEFEKMKKRIIG